MPNGKSSIRLRERCRIRGQFRIMQEGEIVA